MMAVKTGGPAFPQTQTIADHQQGGMRLRDYFAGQALVALALGDRPYEQMAQMAYAIADAMLAERERI